MLNPYVTVEMVLKLLTSSLFTWLTLIFQGKPHSIKSEISAMRFWKKIKTVLFILLLAKPKFFFYLGFLSQTFMNHRTAGEGGGYLFNSPLPFPPALQTLGHWPGDYCRELASAHS